MIDFIKKNQTLISIILFLIIYFIIQVDHPLFIYNVNGSLKQFGVGYKNKTILPVWLLSIVLGILCYIAVKYYTVYIIGY
jgi:hypothetical protein